MTGHRGYIVCDVDDVLADLWRTALPVLNERFGTDAVKSDFINYHVLTDVFGVEWQEFADALIEEKILENLHPVMNAGDCLQSLRTAGYFIHLMTSRGYHPAGDLVTRTWLKYHQLPYDKLTVVPHGEKKGDLVQGILVDYFIDDHDGHLDYATDINVVTKTILVNQPWNQNARESHHRVANITDMITSGVII